MILKNKLYEVIKQNKEDSTVWIELKPDCFIYDSHFPELNSGGLYHSDSYGAHMRAYGV